MLFFQPAQPVYVTVPVFSVKLNGATTQPFRTGHARWPGLIEAVPTVPGQQYQVRVAKDLTIFSRVEELFPGYDLDPDALERWLFSHEVPNGLQLAELIRLGRVKRTPLADIKAAASAQLKPGGLYRGG